MYKFYMYLALTLFAVIAHAQNYCSICYDHTLCIYPGVAAACGEIIRLGLDETEKKAVLDKHNERRNFLALGYETLGNPGPQPSASNMRKLSWDSELEAIAQRWAEQCTFGHDTCRNSERFYVGQNAYLLWSSGPIANIDVEAPVAAFYSEVSKFNPSNINPYIFGYDYGHYSQIVWADTYLVGCGAVMYNDNEYRYYLVCNYGPGGNLIGGSMYEVGAATSNCPEGTSQDAIHFGLCS